MNNKKSMLINILFRVMEFLPVFVFLTLVKIASDNWRLVFLITALVSVLVLVIFEVNRIIINRLTFGIIMYFLAALIVNFSSYASLNRLFEMLQGLGMITVILIISPMFILFSSSGFIGIENIGKSRNLVFSIILYIVVLIIGVYMYLSRFYFNLSPLLTEIVPFVVLFTVHGFLRGLATRV